ncbi:PHD finger protein 1-like isoform X2 [Scyliorhinus canicula]|uniref:PHD finger protein 1-like isoform X2 n=1 Tax=Scyliorhinus canicula TaxID=7830 RepID=UPI0018F3328E|nr:PHD finger protein 1-like isoform X2 [Scyliorhinus canicula]
MAYSTWGTSGRWTGGSRSYSFGLRTTLSSGSCGRTSIPPPCLGQNTSAASATMPPPARATRLSTVQSASKGTTRSATPPRSRLMVESRPLGFVARASLLWPPRWNLKMLQCCRCQHWFHEACTQCLSKPLLYGDRFYLFMCCVCTGGAEYVKRLLLEWVDIAHLILYHLSTCCRRKYFDFEREILAFANENWDNLLVGQLSSASKSERYEQILNALNSHRNRFVSGKEIKKKKCIFGLKERLPPQPPPVATLCELANQLMATSTSPTPNRSMLEGVKKLKAKRTPRHRDPQDLYELKTRRARRLLQKAISQNVVANPSSPNQSYQGCRGSANTCSIRESTERTPPKMMYASIQPSSNNVRSLESSSSSSFEYGENSGNQAKAVGRLSDGEEGVDEHLLDPAETEQEDEEEEDEEEEEDGSDNPMDTRSPCDSSDDDLPLSYLRSSVNSYFGAMGRLARGETVRILARRLTLDNKVQYLVEWGGSSIF